MIDIAGLLPFGSQLRDGRTAGLRLSGRHPAAWRLRGGAGGGDRRRAERAGPRPWRSRDRSGNTAGGMSTYLLGRLFPAAARCPAKLETVQPLGTGGPAASPGRPSSATPCALPPAGCG
ncbi:MAG: hypothetical protein MZV65_43885 [Chromatiales bacterium]|nr:hypothetical protein [Chromatiales bacterium]